MPVHPSSPSLIPADRHTPSLPIELNNEEYPLPDLGFSENSHPNSTPGRGWFVTTPRWETAETLSALWGGSAPVRMDGTGTVQVATGCTSLRILLEGPEAISSRMVRRGGRGLAHICDGRSFLEPRNLYGTPCGCPPTQAARRAAARTGLGPKPDVAIVFRLAEAPGVGRLRLSTSSWDLADDVHPVLDTLRRVGHPVKCLLRTEAAEFTTPGGVAVTFSRPRLLTCDSRPTPAEPHQADGSAHRAHTEQGWST